MSRRRRRSSLEEGSRPHPADALEGLTVLNEPLVTSDGQPNEAAIVELCAAIDAAQRSYERLASDPEWSLAWITSDVDVAGYLARCAVSLCRGVPPRLGEVVGSVLEHLRRGPFADKRDHHGFRFADLSLCDVNRSLWECVDEVEQLRAWEEEAGIGLSPLFHQVCVEVRNDRRHFRAFSVEFDRKYGGAS